MLLLPERQMLSVVFTFDFCISRSSVYRAQHKQKRREKEEGKRPGEEGDEEKEEKSLERGVLK